MTDEKYQRSHPGGELGFQYELKMTALAALRLYNQSDEFFLANNAKDGGKFDDIVFAAKVNDEWTTWFIQLKHLQKPSINSKRITLATLQKGTNRNKSDFLLTKYFESFEGIAKKFDPTSNHVFFKHNYDSTKFVIFTNGKFGSDIEERNFNSVSIDFISTAPEKEKNITFNFVKDCDIFKEVAQKKPTALRDFLSKFYFCSRQACEDECDSIIDEEIKIAVTYLTETGIKFVRGQLCEYLHKLHRSEEYLTKAKLNSFLSQKSIEATLGKKPAFSVTFVPKFLEPFISKIKTEKLLAVSSNDNTTLLCMAALKQEGLTNEPNRHFSLNKLDSKEFQEHLLVHFKDQSSIILIIDCNEASNLKNPEKIILELSNSNSKNKIWLVGSPENEVFTKLSDAVKAKKNKFKCSLANLDYESKKAVMEQCIFFQGYKVRLSEIIDNGLGGLIDMNAISSLLSGQKFEVGLKPLKAIPYYVTRVLTRQTISQSIFQMCERGAKFVLSQTSREEVVNLLPKYSADIKMSSSATNAAKIIVLESSCSESEFNDLSNKFGEVHWLEKKPRAWSWKASSSNAEKCFNYLTDVQEFIPMSKINSICGKFAIITAEPGMGKSTLLVQIAAETKRQLPNFWVVFVSLNDFTDVLRNENFMKNTEKFVKDLIREAAGVQSTTSKLNSGLFDHCYEQGKVVLFLDGFDEISPWYTKQGFAIIKVLSKSHIHRIWITARPIMYEALLKATNSLPFHIKPFESSDQRHFLRKYWQQTIEKFDKEKTSVFIDKVIEIVKTALSRDAIDDFLGIPLQTRMLAELFENNVREFNAKGELDLPKNMNGLTLFQSFVDKKLQVLQEKAKLVPSNPLAQEQFQKMRSDAEERLMKLGLLTLLETKECACLHPPVKPYEAIELKDAVTNGADKTGIVVSFKGQTPLFIHRTFAEYFVAKFFARNAKENAQFLTSEIYNSITFNSVRFFYDRILTVGCDLHTAILNRESNKVMLLLQSANKHNQEDNSGRTALHLAASLPKSKKIIQLLLNSGADREKKDRTLQWTALDFALASKDVGNIVPLLSKENFINPTAEVIPVNLESFKIAVSCDHLPLFTWLLEQGMADVVNAVDLPAFQWLDDEVRVCITIFQLLAAWNAASILHVLLLKTPWSPLMLESAKNGETALMMAAIRGNSNAVSILLRANVSMDSKTKSGLNIFEVAVSSHNEEILSHALWQISSRNLSPELYLPNTLASLICDKSQWAARALVHLLQVYPHLYNCASNRGLPLIALAVVKSNSYAVKLLVNLGADINFKLKSYSLLHMAASRGSLEVVDAILCHRKRKIDAMDDNGKTPLYVATEKGNFSVVELLVEYGADLKCKTKEGNNLSHAAAHSCDQILIDYLASKGVNFRMMNNMGVTGYDILQQKGQANMVPSPREMRKLLKNLSS